MKVTVSRQHIARLAPLLEPDVPLSEPRADGMTDFDPAISTAISLKRIADALGRLAECADGVHPSAFRVLNQG